MKDIKNIAYQKYRLDWMIQRGYTIDDLIHSAAHNLKGSPTPERTANVWESTFGFNNEIWVCYEEFIDNEYEDVEYMRQILGCDEFEDYCYDNDKAICQWCGEVTEFTDDGGRTEKDIGWMCNKCIEAVKSRGEELHFLDEEIE